MRVCRDDAQYTAVLAALTHSSRFYGTYFRRLEAVAFAGELIWKLFAVLHLIIAIKKIIIIKKTKLCSCFKVRAPKLLKW